MRIVLLGLIVLMSVVSSLMVGCGAEQARDEPDSRPAAGAVPVSVTSSATTSSTATSTTTTSAPEAQGGSSSTETGASAATSVSTTTTSEPKAVVVTVLYDNRAVRSDVRTDWGFACLVRGLEKTVLFDTGADGGILLDNMRTLGVDTGVIDAVVLSHEHSDHTGGIGDLLAENPAVTVYYPATFSERTVRRLRSAEAEPVPVDEPVSVCPGLTLTGPLGSSVPEMGLVVEGRWGPALITGCAHPGIAVMAGAAGELAGCPLGTVMGGFHLSRCSTGEIQAVIERLQQLEVRRCAPAHCTGDQAIAQIEEAFGADFIRMGAGAVVEL